MEQGQDHELRRGEAHRAGKNVGSKPKKKEKTQRLRERVADAMGYHDD